MPAITRARPPRCRGDGCGLRLRVRFFHQCRPVRLNCIRSGQADGGRMSRLMSLAEVDRRLMSHEQGCGDRGHDRDHSGLKNVVKRWPWRPLRDLADLPDRERCRVLNRAAPFCAARIPRLRFIWARGRLEFSRRAKPLIAHRPWPHYGNRRRPPTTRPSLLPGETFPPNLVRV